MNNTIFQSPRFWGIAAIFLLQVAVICNLITTEQSLALTHAIQAFIAGIVGVATIDRSGDKKVEAAKIAASSVPIYQMSNVTSTFQSKKK